ncbi:heat-inducible transcriptional repressor HrcA [Zhihengliuella flava]|uniref:Heat-inducible transcription repressor HrcA n=1 Tax=Zhihengliuella flava TaxID=1285193 RepID=A0A931D2U6_9MICC|nr:heat-inducible transcriptional repressor HrcA [Zhihengliuella flava]MBG6083354.1 heat-inducible transcriptional repressor [Zhihengliuella flava]
MSEARRLEVLRAIVEDFVHSREPVGSKMLLDRHQLGVSAATIRNDMAQLEEEGLIVAPHTSSGRIPTEQGYRRFVDRIEDVRPLSAAERRAIQALIDGASDVDEVMERTVRLLAQLTNQVAVLQVPQFSRSVVRHIELVGLGGGRTLVVLIASNGHVDQRVAQLDPELSEDDLHLVKNALLRGLANARLEEIARLCAAVVETLPHHLHDAGTRVGTALAALSDHRVTDRIVMAGTANLARSNRDFSLTITPVLEALEEQVVLLRLLSELELDRRGIAVRIGRENFYDGFEETSLVATAYGPDQAAKVGVLGPTRMDYSSSMAAVRAIARYLSRILST